MARPTRCCWSSTPPSARTRYPKWPSSTGRSGVTALAVTKLDGTAKAGVVIAIAAATGLPLRFIGVGEGVEDLQDFEAAPFVDALLMEP